jgi:uridine kinase
VQTVQYTIGITGGSGSGKSYLIQALRAKFKTDEVAIISQDNYYKKREEQSQDAKGVQNFDLPTSFVMNDFEHDFVEILEGKTVNRKEYTYNNQEVSPGAVVLKPAPVLIVEGLFIFSLEKVWDALDLKVFVDASDVVKVKRRILRDRVERNYPLEDVLYRYEHHVLPSYHTFIEPYKSRVDVVLNNHDSMVGGVDLLSGFIRGLLG